MTLEARLGEMEEVRRATLLTVLRDYIQSFTGWNLFLTQTFAHELRGDLADAALDRVSTYLQKRTRRSHGFLGAELHRSGTVHLHGLFGVAGSLSRTALWTDLHRRFGFARIEPVRSRAQVTAYCTKYVTKNLAEWLIW